MKPHERLLLNNKSWAKAKRKSDPDYFRNLAEGQTPQFLWIGCSDSRVPSSVVTESEHGDMFVHRNIANVIPKDDTACLSVLQYAVEVLKVPYVIVCGHYGCGGIKAAMSGKSLGLIDDWLKHIHEVQEKYSDTLAALDDEQDKQDKMVELNIQHQLQNIGQTNIVQNAWQEGKGPVLLGWVYRFSDGEIDQLVEIQNDEELKELI